MFLLVPSCSASFYVVGFFIIQPGSTVATSLSREEAGEKHCAVVTVKDKQFKSKAIPLQTVRQVFVQELVLEDVPIRKMPRTTTVRQENMPVCYCA